MQQGRAEKQAFLIYLLSRWGNCAGHHQPKHHSTSTKVLTLRVTSWIKKAPWLIKRLICFQSYLLSPVHEFRLVIQLASYHPRVIKPLVIKELDPRDNDG